MSDNCSRSTYSVSKYISYESVIIAGNWYSIVPDIFSNPVTGFSFTGSCSAYENMPPEYSADELSNISNVPSTYFIFSDI